MRRRGARAISPAPCSVPRPPAAPSPWKESKRSAPPRPPASASSLPEVLLSRAEREADRPHIYLPQEDGTEQKITYGQLVDAAGAVAQGLLEQGLRRHETVALMLPTGSDFFFTFFGVLFAGGIPVPLYPPVRMDQIEEYARRQIAILQKADARFLIASGRVEGLGRLLQPMVPGLSDVTTFEALRRAASERPKVDLRAEDPALIQFTSGSTGLPKGVLLAHENVLANIRAIGQAAQIGPGDVGVSWLPLYHDMGLIGSWLGALYFGIPITILSPLTFLTRPERWLWAIHYHRGTHSAAPNFAYELCVRKIDERAIEGLDLSSWRVAFNGAEPVSPETLERFTKRFAPYGFRKETFFPVYGLAESSVALTFPPSAGRRGSI
ncbi:MAG: AMP-binding protein [Candidatus Manganitrophus sp.]|nr:MAG: AMP-binding protein [Candidatus Manganitrophus sp.]